MNGKKQAIISVPLDDLLAHAKNSNVTPPTVLEKIERNIRRTGHYPPLIVRQVSKEKFQILDGHWRKEILKKLHYTHADCVVWDVDELEGDKAIATLNTLHGTEDKDKRVALLRSLAETIPVDELALILPEDEETLRTILSIANDDAATIAGAMKTDQQEFVVMEFRVTKAGKTVIDEALSRVKRAVLEGGSTECGDGTALEYIAADYISGTSSTPET